MSANFSRRTAIGIASVSLAVAAGGGGIALAVAGTGAEKVVLHSRAVGPPGVEGVNSSGPIDRIPARMLPADAPPPAPGLITVTNGWEVSNGAGHVVVYAGSAPDDSSIGRFMIVRETAPAGDQTVRTVDVPGSGAVSITNAPSGAAVETSAQRGQLGYKGARGGSGVLSLDTETASAH